MFTQTNAAKSNRQLADGKHASGLLPYPIEMSPFLAISQIALDATGVPSSAHPAGYQPTIIVQCALAHWNQYLATNDERHLEAFLAQAHWLIEHESRVGKDAGGWPISLPCPAAHSTGPWLSALTQGNGISVLLRAYRLTAEQAFFEVARRAVRTFELDILDGGVSVAIGEWCVVLEEVGACPAAHTLSGFIFALLGLYDYVELTGDAQIEKLISRSLATMHHLLDEFDAGYWTRSDLLHRQLASPPHLALQAALLEVLSEYSGCNHCSTLASRWKSYQRRFGMRLRYLIRSRCSACSRAILGRVRTALFSPSHNARPFRMCVPITTFPVLGVIRTVLPTISRLTKDTWQLEYITQHVGPNPERFTIARFGQALTSPWQFPFVFLSFLPPFRTLISLMRHGANYQVLLPQDGVFTGAFAALAGKLAGVRVVCIDHGNLTRR